MVPVNKTIVFSTTNVSICFLIPASKKMVYKSPTLEIWRFKAEICLIL